MSAFRYGAAAISLLGALYFLWTAVGSIRALPDPFATTAAAIDVFFVLLLAGLARYLIVTR